MEGSSDSYDEVLSEKGFLQRAVKHILNKAKGYDFFGCVACEKNFPNVNGEPGQAVAKQEKKEKEPLSEFLCVFCKRSKLIRRQGISQKTGKEYDFYACSGFPKCKGTFPLTVDGLPFWEKGKK